MSTQATTFDAAGEGPVFSVQPRQSITYASVGDGSFDTAYVALQRSRTQGAAWSEIDVGTVAGDISGSFRNETNAEERFRFVVYDEAPDAETPLTLAGTTTCTIADAVDTVRELKDNNGRVYATVDDDGVNFVGNVTAAGAVAADGLLNVGTTTLTGSVRLNGDVFVYFTDGAPVDYTDGTPPATGEGEGGIGSLCIDYTNGKVYVNGGTKAEPVWKIVTSA